MGSEQSNKDQSSPEPKRVEGEYGDDRRRQDRSDAAASKKMGDEGRSSEKKSSV
ncbi:hypothetical protein [Paracoccus yeei]|uniref:hypothetical protein n=1 Tax=Paracoccus yeei TaxID=147645 RepID=UPI003BF83050